MTEDPTAAAPPVLVDVSGVDGVPETMLWTLRNRAIESARPDSAFDDPLAEDLYARIGDHADFGDPSESHPLRAVAFDRVTREFLAEHPDGTVVALGEGLQTSYWRLGRPSVRWVSVDVAEAVALRERLLPAEVGMEHLACSALDRSWMATVEPDDGVLVTAEGLLMYFQPDEVRSLIADCAVRFPGGAMVFDSIPVWFSDQTLDGHDVSATYTAPPMPFGLDVDHALALGESIPGVRSATDIPLPAGRALWKPELIDQLGHARPSITLLDFDTADPTGPT
ncbi:MAG: class I SAM-dependent methyltransferase [Actinomycetota bacterium]